MCIRDRRYADLAESFTSHDQPMLIITHGVSGSGKSIASGVMVEAIGAIRIRSDAERQRLFSDGQARKNNNANVGEGIYTADATEKTYQHLLDLAEVIVSAGYTAIGDATFLKAKYRASWGELAHRLGVPFYILDMHCDTPTLERFVTERLKAGVDISEANLEVLHHQLETREPLSEVERKHALVIHCDAPIGAQIGEWLPRLISSKVV